MLLYGLMNFGEPFYKMSVLFVRYGTLSYFEAGMDLALTR